jgi:hypothetical protein
LSPSTTGAVLSIKTTLLSISSRVTRSGGFDSSSVATTRTR